MDIDQYHVQRMAHSGLLLQHVSVSVFNVFQPLLCNMILPNSLARVNLDNSVHFSLKFSLLADVECEEPNIPNAAWVEGARPPYRYKYTVTYECTSGYKMNGMRTLECDIDGQWAPGIPTCEGE